MMVCLAEDEARFREDMIAEEIKRQLPRSYTALFRGGPEAGRVLVARYFSLMHRFPYVNVSTGERWAHLYRLSAIVPHSDDVDFIYSYHQTESSNEPNL